MNFPNLPIFRPPFRPVLLILLLFSIICTQIPLFNYLGFEFSAVLALLGGFCSGIIVISEWNRQKEHAGVVRFYRSVSLLTLLLLVPPILILIANALFVKNCSMSQGLLLVALLAVPAVLFTNALALAVVVLFKRWQKTIYTALVLAVLSHILIRTFATPQIFAFNPILGFFPGITYDESLNVTGRLALYRVGTIAAAALIVLCADLLMKRKAKQHLPSAQLFAGSLGIVIIMGLFYFSNELGFSSSERYIASVLGGVDSTEHFVIYYPKNVLSDEKAHELALLHEFYYWSLMRELRVVPTRRIHSFVYASAEQKGRLMGAAGTDVSKPWLWQLHINLGDVDGALKHELVHVMAAEFGFPILRVSVNSGLIEGLAVAVERVEYDETLHRLAAGIFALGLQPDMESLFSVTGFMQVHGATSYVLAGSFCRYLIDRYGMRRFKWLYRTGSFAALYNRDFGQLVREWKRYLAEPRPSGSDLYKAAYLFQRPSIFGKECARVIANLNMRTRELMREGKYEEAVTLSQRSLDLTTSPEAIFQHAQSLFRSGNFEETIRFSSKAMNDSAIAHVLLPLYLTIGDAYWSIGNIDAAERAYERLYSIHLSLGWDEALGLRLASLRDRRNREVMREFLQTEMPDSVRVDWLTAKIDSGNHSPLLQYALGRSLMVLDQYKEAIAALTAVPSLDLGVLEFVRYRRLGRSYFETGDYEKAKVFFWESLNFTSKQAHQIQTDEWLTRCDWMEAVQE